MSGFVSSPAPEITPSGQMLDCGPFWSAIDLNHFRDAQRIGGTLIPNERVEMALASAAMTADGDLTEWRLAQEEQGYATLADVPAPVWFGMSKFALLWRAAVYGHATADLIETHSDVSATGAGQTRGEAMGDRAEDHRRAAIHAIRAIKGVKRTTVALI